MKKADRKAELARQKRALKQSKRSNKPKEYLSYLLSQDNQTCMDWSLVPLRQSILLALGITGTLGCQVTTPYTRDIDESGTSSIMAGSELSAGELQAGELQGGELRGGESVSGIEVMAGFSTAGSELMAGAITAGQEGGTSSIAGEMIAGEVAAGEMNAGETTAGMTTPITSICTAPMVELNDQGEPNGYTVCTEGITIKTGPANCSPSDRTNACQQDSDCAANEQCLCAGQFARYPQCTPSTCTSGDSCNLNDGEGACAVSLKDDNCEYFVSLACFTDNDECRSREECDYGSCYSTTEGWRCNMNFCGEGRPLLNNCELTLAPLIKGAGWVTCASTHEGFTGSELELAQVQEYWHLAAQLEHSSVASFARFTMQMLSFGVPADILLSIQKATADEVKHAQGAAQIFSVLSGEQVTFGSLPLEGVTLQTSRQELIETLIREACISETLGVAEIAEALRLCKQEQVSAHLSTLLVDETMHAELAWRSLQWLIKTADDEDQEQLVQHTLDTFEQVAKNLGLSDQRHYSGFLPHHRILTNATLNNWGVLTDSQVQVLRQQAYHEVILPCIHGLTEQVKSA